jgi:hypothetical protein
VAADLSEQTEKALDVSRALSGVPGMLQLHTYLFDFTKLHFEHPPKQTFLPSLSGREQRSPSSLFLSYATIACSE